MNPKVSVRMSESGYVVIGQAVKAFGIKGEIKINPFTESFAAFENSQALVFGDVKFNVRAMRVHKKAVLVKLEGIQTPEDALQLIGLQVKTQVGNLPPKEEDEYYWFELIGMKVSTAEGRYLGTIREIIPTPANDVLSVIDEGTEILIPMIEEMVLEVDVENKTMIASLPDGLIPDDVSS